MSEKVLTNELKIEESYIVKEPYYKPVKNEFEIFLHAYKNKLPVLLKGPTGCGKTRFVEYMAWGIKNKANMENTFLITVPCHEDLTANDLVGRYYFDTQKGSVWVDGPLTKAVRYGGICYLDEIVEARKDVIVLIHSLTDHRRILPLIKRGTQLVPPRNFMLVISYNPHYQSVLKEMKPSTRQRFVSIDFDYPAADIEKEIVIKESGVRENIAESLVKAANKIRALKEHGLTEGVSTRLLIYAGQLIVSGLNTSDAVESAIVSPLTDDTDIVSSIRDILLSFGIYKRK